MEKAGDWPLSHHTPIQKNLGMQIVTPNSTYPQHNHTTTQPPLVSISVQNALGITLPVPKTIFQQVAEFSQAKGKKWCANDALCFFCASEICVETL